MHFSLFYTVPETMKDKKKLLFVFLMIYYLYILSFFVQSSVFLWFCILPYNQTIDVCVLHVLEIVIDNFFQKFMYLNTFFLVVLKRFVYFLGVYIIQLLYTCIFTCNEPAPSYEKSLPCIFKHIEVILQIAD